jgi:hypothetical protein
MGLKVLINSIMGLLGYKVVRVVSRNDGIHLAPAAANGNSGQNAVRPPVENGPAKPAANLKLTPAANHPPVTCTFHAPETNGAAAGRFDANIAEFRSGGITVIERVTEKADEWCESEQFECDVSNRHLSWDWAGNSPIPYTDGLLTGLPSRKLVKELKALLTTPDFDAFFRQVLGCPVTVVNCRLVRSLPHNGEGVGPQSWHGDGCPAGIIRGIIYLTDVDEQTGPFQYKDAGGVEHTVLGKTGDLLIFDATRLLHRAMPPKNRVRTAIDFVFLARMPGDEFDIMVAGMNHWPADPFFFSRPKEPRIRSFAE